MGVGDHRYAVGLESFEKSIGNLEIDTSVESHPSKNEWWAPGWYGNPLEQGHV
jgi:hypothetical protein